MVSPAYLCFFGLLVSGAQELYKVTPVNDLFSVYCEEHLVQLPLPSITLMKGRAKLWQYHHNQVFAELQFN